MGLLFLFKGILEMTINLISKCHFRENHNYECLLKITKIEVMFFNQIRMMKDVCRLESKIELYSNYQHMMKKSSFR